MQKIITVEDTFQIKDWDLIIVGKTLVNSPQIEIGNFVIIVHPNGKKVRAKISSIPFINPPNFEYTNLQIADLTKEEVPVGSEVFLDKQKVL